MAKAKVVGTRSVDFKDSNGQRILGLSVYVTRKEDGVNGELSDRIFIRQGSVPNLPVFSFGSTYEFIYDGFGKKQSLVEVKKCPVNL